MGELRSALARSLGLPLRSLPNPPGALANAAAKLPERPPIELKGPEPYDEIASAIYEKLKSGQPLSNKELRRSPWCLWGSNPALAATSALSMLLVAIESAPNARPLKTLASAFVQNFDPGGYGMAAVSAMLARRARDLGGPWASLQTEYAIFAIREGPLRITQAALASGRTPTRLLSESGLGVLAAQSSYAKACAKIALERLASSAQIAPQERFELIKATGLKANGRLAFEEHAPLVANALLLPYQNAAPEKALGDEILDLALRLFGDPRLRSSWWVRMEDAAAVVRRWLVRASLRQFLDIVNEIAPEYMWRYRRAFWEAVEKRDLIKDARVVFGKDGELVARRYFGGQLPFSIFAKGGGTVQSDHAVLLMTIGSGIVAEWSHNGKCVIWSDAVDENAPRMHLPEYSASKLRWREMIERPDAPMFAVSHLGSETYNWQHKVAAKIYWMTSVRTKQFEYEI